MNIPYTVRKTKYKSGSLKDNEELVGLSHGSWETDFTLCGKEINSDWWYITNNSFDGEITCKECLRPAHHHCAELWIKTSQT